MHERLHGASRRLGTAYLLRRLDRRDAAHPHARHHGGDLPRVRPAPPPAAPTPASCSPRRTRESRRARSTASTCSTPAATISARRRACRGLTRVLQGISPANFDWELAPGARFETPEAVMAYSGAGFGGLSACFHRYVNEHLIPPDWQGRPRPPSSTTAGRAACSILRNRSSCASAGRQSSSAASCSSSTTAGSASETAILPALATIP